MKFNVQAKQLHALSASVSRIINSKNALNILNNFKLTLEEDRLTLLASDGENFLSGSTTVTEVEGAGTTCIDAKRLVDTLKDLPDVGITVDINTEDNYNVLITYPNGEFNFMGFDGADFPLPKQEAAATPMRLTLPAANIARAIDYTIFAVGNDEYRPQLMGIYWDIKPDKVVFVGSDTRKLVSFADASIAPGIDTSFILPLKSALILKNVFTADDDVLVEIEEKGVNFSSADFTFNSRFLLGKYPDYERVIPKNSPYKLNIERSTLRNALRRIGPYCDAANGLVRIKLHPTSMIMKASESSYNASAWETATCEFDGPDDMVLGFSAPYMTEVVNTMPGSNITIQLSDPSRPGIFVPAEDEPETSLVMILMPMLVSEF